jgi:choline-sulfatase
MLQPNIILILTDHFRRDAIGEWTPHLRKLAARGVRFENATCAAPLCQPSRCSIITGMFPSQHGVCGNQNDPVPDGLRDGAFMHRLRTAGYTTALVGKHHYIDRYGVGMDVCDDADEIRRYGFDHVTQVVDDSERAHNSDDYSRYLEQNGKLEEWNESHRVNAGPCGPQPFEPDESPDGFIGTRGIRFVEEHVGDGPFYLNLSFIGPHPPLWHPGEPRLDASHVPPPICAEDTDAVRQRRWHYLEKCALIDDYVGRLVETLDRKGLSENTVVIFTSDHGENAGDYGIWDKRWYYEQSCGVPLIVAGPGVPSEERRNGPRVSKALVSHVDLYPTILRFAGIELPPDRRRTGRDLIAPVRYEPGSGHDAVYAQLGTSAMVRTATWKLVFDPQAGGVRQLFNLAGDPGERTNLAGVAGYEAVTAGLVERILSHHIRLHQHTHIKEEQRVQPVCIP